MSSAANGNRKKSTSTGSSKKVGVTSLPRKTSGLGGAVVDHFSQTRIKEVNNADGHLETNNFTTNHFISFAKYFSAVVELLLVLLNCCCFLFCFCCLYC